MRVALFAIALLGCGSPVNSPPAEKEPLLIGMRVAEDLDPRPEVLKVAVRAMQAPVALAPELTPTLWTYGGSLPGPLLRVPVGGTIELELDNALEEPTTVHWHGMRVPNAQDGVVLGDVPAILPGETRRYVLPARDPGLFWYHPHVHSAAQLGFGLYGAIWVEDPSERAVADDDVILVLSDLGVSEDGVLDKPEVGGDLGTLFGREGRLVLVNGQLNPKLEATAGRRQRWRLVNAARSRYFSVALPGHRMWKIGGDGGLMDAPVEITAIELIPGDRADVVVEPQQEGELQVLWTPVDRGYGSTEFREPVELLRYAVAPGERAPTGEPPPLPGRPPPRVETETTTTVRLELTQSPAGGAFYLGINGIPADRATAVHAHIGDTFSLEIVNAMDWDHPFHVHGYFFEELDDAGRPRTPRVLEDTINVPRKDARRVKLHFDERPGAWMFHCHILDHADAGMMSMFMVTEPHD